MDQIGRQSRQAIWVIVCPAILDGHVLALNKSGFVQALPERVNKVRRTGCRRISEEADYRYRLLRARRDRPRQRTADQRDERTPPQLIELHSMPCQPAVRISNRQGQVSG